MKSFLQYNLLLLLAFTLMACPPRKGNLIGLSICKESNLTAINAVDSDLYFIDKHEFNHPIIQIDLSGVMGEDATAEILWTKQIQNGQATARIILNKGESNVKERIKAFYFDFQPFLSTIPEGTPIYLLDDEIVLSPTSK